MRPHSDRAWVNWAIGQLEADATRSSDTHLHVFPLPSSWGIDLYLKDETVHPTGSLKHRLARSLILYALVNGDIVNTTTLVEASSGSTAVSEAYFARMLGLPFIAVIPKGTSVEKVALIESYGGRCSIVESADQMGRRAQQIADSCGGHFLDQFTNASRATDWRGNNNIAERVFEQMSCEKHPVPSWVVFGAGTGGTSATFGRYIRYRRFTTRVALVDTVGSVFAEAWRTRDFSITSKVESRIEGSAARWFRNRLSPRSSTRSLPSRMLRLSRRSACSGSKQGTGRADRREQTSSEHGGWHRQCENAVRKAASSPSCVTAALATWTPTTPTRGLKQRESTFAVIKLRSKRFLRMNAPSSHLGFSAGMGRYSARNHRNAIWTPLRQLTGARGGG